MNKNKIGMLFFIGSEAFFFIALIIAYVYYSHSGGKLAETAHYLDIKRTAVFTVFLLSSSIAIWMAGTAYSRGKRKKALSRLSLAILLGAIFLIGQGIEYSRLISQDVTISRNVFGSSFFALTGFHGLHVLAGLILLSLITGLIGSGKFRKMEATAFESISLYWHFVDAVWVVLFITVYIGSII
jgi:heme/copper-type cytochrome/quinol oxidase subunit 3